jgi:hypothetical protein
MRAERARPSDLPAVEALLSDRFSPAAAGVEAMAPVTTEHRTKAIDG